MAEVVEVTRPDGETVTVSRKAFNLIYRGRGYTEGSRGDATPLAASDEAEETSDDAEAEQADEPEPAAESRPARGARRRRRE